MPTTVFYMFLKVLSFQIIHKLPHFDATPSKPQGFLTHCAVKSQEFKNERPLKGKNNPPNTT